MVVFFQLVVIFILSNHIYAFDNYDIYFLGIPIIEVNMESNNHELDFQTKSRGIFSSIWTVENNYYTRYDSITYGIRYYSKTVQQGNYSGGLNCEYVDEKLVLKCDKIEIAVNDSIQNIFTLLAQLSYKTPNYLDSKWFRMNHEGMDYKARFLFIGTEEIEVNNSNILCEHYKLDLVKIHSSSSQLSPWDYFTDNIGSQDALRQLWVETGSGRKKIIKASVSLYGMVMTAEINNY